MSKPKPSGISVVRVEYPYGSRIQLTIGDQSWVITLEEADDLVDSLRAGVQIVQAEERSGITPLGSVN